MRLFTEAERVEIWGRRQAGEGNRSIGRRLGRSAGSIRSFVESSGGVWPPVRRGESPPSVFQPMRPSGPHQAG